MRSSGASAAMGDAGLRPGSATALFWTLCQSQERFSKRDWFAGRGPLLQQAFAVAAGTGPPHTRFYF